MSSSDTEDELPPLNKDITSPSHNAANLQTVKKKSQRTINNPQAGPRTSNENPNQFKVISTPKGSNKADLIRTCTRAIISKFFQRIRCNRFKVIGY